MENDRSVFVCNTLFEYLMGHALLAIHQAILFQAADFSDGLKQSADFSDGLRPEAVVQ